MMDDGKKNGNDPAFLEADDRRCRMGLTKREEFAKAAMSGLLANPGGPIQASDMSGWTFCNCEAKNVAEVAVDLADALLAELAKTEVGG